ncbi:SUKH-4 family immunity protein [Kitasatospora purpeofusca]|uniref:SUKH-4 family immunity protein n=1 Tax=Kitasatospora purpeofusca TaxID=67352 RepID=UPI002E12579F|nr:SUKH-4 family immunity protein [Kitasatospora purpeofusca]WSR45283.1 SUKH-4 family immunity protein [Kitasatospora purpeofusca]
MPLAGSHAPPEHRLRAGHCHPTPPCGRPPRRHSPPRQCPLGRSPEFCDLDVALDGATGRIELSDRFDDDLPAPYLHRDLGTVLHVLWAYERLRAERRRWSRPAAPSPWAVFRPQEFLDGVAEGVLRALDPSAWETEEHFWPMRADDCHMGELLE